MRRGAICRVEIRESAMRFYALGISREYNMRAPRGEWGMLLPYSTKRMDTAERKHEVGTKRLTEMKVEGRDGSGSLIA